MHIAAVVCPQAFDGNQPERSMTPSIKINVTDDLVLDAGTVVGTAESFTIHPVVSENKPTRKSSPKRPGDSSPE
jgi:hypothetical protein